LEYLDDGKELVEQLMVANNGMICVSTLENPIVAMNSCNSNGVFELLQLTCSQALAVKEDFRNEMFGSVAVFLQIKS
jgi:hypothetical protein